MQATGEHTTLLKTLRRNVYTAALDDGLSARNHQNVSNIEGCQQESSQTRPRELT